jgi:hypothetical protein
MLITIEMAPECSNSKSNVDVKRRLYSQKDKGGLTYKWPASDGRGASVQHRDKVGKN